MIFIFSETFGVVRDFMDVFAHVSMCASCFMIVALTCERHFAIDSPHQVSYLSQGPLITDGRNCNEMWILSSGLL